MYTYPVLFAAVFVYHAFSFSVLKYLIPVFLVSVPYAFRARIGLGSGLKDLGLGLGVSAAVLLPFFLVLSLAGRSFVLPTSGFLLVQLFGVSFPEEVYFRGFLQERLGNDLRALLITSVLFSIMHLPKLIFLGDPAALLTFFPSLVMGFLYLRTSNVIPSTIFHFLSNVLYLGSL